MLPQGSRHSFSPEAVEVAVSRLSPLVLLDTLASS